MSVAFVHAHDCSEPHTDAVWAVAWTANDAAVSISADGSIKRWDSTSGQPAHALPAHALGLVSLSISPDGRFALYNSLEGLTSLWDLENGDIVGKHESYVRKEGSGEPAWSVSMNPTGTTYASTGGGGNVIIRSAVHSSFGEQVATLVSGRSKFGMSVKHSPDGRQVAMASEAGQVYVFDVESGQLAATYSSHAMAVRSLAWSPDGQLLISASEDKRLVLHDARQASAAGRQGAGAVATLAGHTSWVLSADVSPDNRLLLSGSADKSIKIWDLAARTAVGTLQDTGEVWSVSWRPHAVAAGASAGAFVSGGEDGVVKWWRGAGAG